MAPARQRALHTMFGRALIGWLVLLMTAVVNGAAREALIVPYAGETAGRAMSTVSLAVLILLLSWLTIGWIRPGSRRDAWAVGALWVALTVLFEFLAGHYLFGTPWSLLLEDYDIARGRIWLLVLVTTAAAPYLTARVRGLV